jgi:hypothetical protein
VRRRDIEKFQESYAGHHSSTYIVAGGVALESAGVDLDICTIDINSSALEVACPPPGIGAKISDSSFCQKCSGGAEK